MMFSLNEAHENLNGIVSSYISGYRKLETQDGEPAFNDRPELIKDFIAYLHAEV